MIMEERCPMDCYGQGMCMHNNTCQCLHGFTGDDCNKGLPKEQDPFVTSFDWRNRGKPQPRPNPNPNPSPKPKPGQSASESQSEGDSDPKPEKSESESEGDADDDEDPEESGAEGEEEEPEEAPLSEEAKNLMASIEKLQKSHDYWKIRVIRLMFNIEKYNK